MKETKLITMKEAADYLNISKNRLYYMVFKKAIPYIKIGASTRFSPEALEVWLNSCKQNPARKESK